MLQNGLLHLSVFPYFQRPSLEICRASRIYTCLASRKKYLWLPEGDQCCLRRWQGMGPGVSLQSMHAVFRPRLPAAVLTGHQDFQVPGHCVSFLIFGLFNKEKKILVLRDRAGDRKAWPARDGLSASCPSQRVIYPKVPETRGVLRPAICLRLRRKMRCNLRTKKASLLPSPQTPDCPPSRDLLVKVSALCRLGRDGSASDL